MLSTQSYVSEDRSGVPSHMVGPTGLRSLWFLHRHQLDGWAEPALHTEGNKAGQHAAGTLRVRLLTHSMGPKMVQINAV